MNANHESPEMTSLRHVGMSSRLAASLAEFHCDVIGMHQEIDPNTTEEELPEELQALSRRSDFTALATRNGLPAQ